MLVTGWEPDVPVGDTLVRRFVHAMADRGAAMAAATGGRAERTPDAAFADLGSEIGMDNAAVLLRPPPAVDLEAVVARASAFFPEERPWVVLSAYPLPPPDRYGLELVGHPLLMLRPPGPLPAPPPGLEVAAVEGPERLAHFDRVLAAGFGADPALVAMRPEAAALLQLFVGYEGGRPVACAGTWAAQGVVQVNWVATVPEARGRGYALALTAAAVAAWPSLPAVLLSDDPGRPVYHRLGFLDLLRCTMWQHPGRSGHRS